MTNFLFDIQTNNKIHNVTNQNRVKKTFINNNTFSGCLHFMGMVQHFHFRSSR